MRRKIYFRADADAQIGYGHFIRTLALADMLKDDFDCVFFTSNPTTYQIEQMDRVCRFVGLHEESKLGDFLGYLGGNEIVVLDNYFFTTDYQRQIRSKGCKLVCIDDMHDKHYVADVVINHGPVLPEELDCEAHTQLCLGDDYKLLRKPFLLPLVDRPRNDAAIVIMGGADPYRLVDKVIYLLLDVNPKSKIVVVLGDMANLSEENRRKVEVRSKLSAEELAELFETSAFGIFPASTVSIEASSRGLPMMVGYYVDNQEEGYMKAAKEGRFVPLGCFHKLTRQTLQRALEKLEDFSPYILDTTRIQKNFLNLFNFL